MLYVLLAVAVVILLLQVWVLFLLMTWEPLRDEESLFNAWAEKFLPQ